jgi:hypothetical protein
MWSAGGRWRALGQSPQTDVLRNCPAGLNEPEIYVTRYEFGLEELDTAHIDGVDLIKARLTPEVYQRVRDLMEVNQFLGELVELPKSSTAHSCNVNLFREPSTDQPWS